MSERVSGEPFRKFGDLSPLSESLIPCMDRDWKDPLRRFRDFSENDLGFLGQRCKNRDLRSLSYLWKPWG